MSVPQCSRRGAELTIDVVESGLKTELVEAVVDVDDGGGVIGVEILGLMVRHPGVAAHAMGLQGPASKVAVSFDPDADALYLRFDTGRSWDQQVKPAVVLFGPNDELLRVVVHLE